MRPLLVLVVVSALFASGKRAVSTVKLLDFTEARYTGATFVFGLGSCVNRDYTLEVGAYILVLRQSTCRPSLNPAVPWVVGEDVQMVKDKERIGILDQKGRPQWLKLFKTTKKPAAEGK